MALIQLGYSANTTDRPDGRGARPPAASRSRTSACTAPTRSARSAPATCGSADLGAPTRTRSRPKRERTLLPAGGGRGPGLGHARGVLGAKQPIAATPVHQPHARRRGDAATRITLLHGTHAAPRSSSTGHPRGPRREPEQALVDKLEELPISERSPRRTRALADVEWRLNRNADERRGPGAPGGRASGGPAAARAERARRSEAASPPRSWSCRGSPG